MAKEIWITETDRKRLLGVIEELNVSRDKRDLPHIAQLETEVSRARVIEQSTEVPPDVITMRSRVKLRNVSKGGSAEYTLVYPSEANAEERRISVLAPLGTAMIG